MSYDHLYCTVSSSLDLNWFIPAEDMAHVAYVISWINCYSLSYLITGKYKPDLYCMYMLDLLNDLSHSAISSSSPLKQSLQLHCVLKSEQITCWHLVFLIKNRGNNVNKYAWLLSHPRSPISESHWINNTSETKILNFISITCSLVSLLNATLLATWVYHTFFLYHSSENKQKPNCFVAYWNQCWLYAADVHLVMHVDDFIDEANVFTNHTQFFFPPALNHHLSLTVFFFQIEKVEHCTNSHDLSCL